MESALEKLFKKWEQYLNNDKALRERCGPNFHQYGTTSRSSIFEEPGLSTFGKDLGPNKALGTELYGKEILELCIAPKNNFFTVKLDGNGVFFIEMRGAENPLVRAKMPLEIFKAMVLDECSVMWAFLNKDTRLVIDKELTYSNFCRVLEILVCLQELLDIDPKIREDVEALC